MSTDICADPWLLQGRSPDDKTVSGNLEAPQASKLSKIIFENVACTRSVGQQTIQPWALPAINNKIGKGWSLTYNQSTVQFFLCWEYHVPDSRGLTSCSAAQLLWFHKGLIP